MTRCGTYTSITIEIVRKFADQTKFVVHSRRWAKPAKKVPTVRSTVGRRAEGAERTIHPATAFLYAAAALVLIKRIARYA